MTSGTAKSMYACVMRTPGGPDVLEYRKVDRPRIEAPFDVLVRIRGAGINPADCGQRSRGTASGLRRPGAAPIAPGLPVLGTDGAGIVEEIGEKVTNVEKGAEVYFCDGGWGLNQGNYAQYKVVDSRYLSLKPATMDFSTAAALPLVLITAWEAMIECAEVKRDDVVLIQGGAGGVGHIALQLAKAYGAIVAVTVSGDNKAKIARELGADCIIRYHQEDVGEALRKWSGKAGADIVFDTIGGDVLARSVDLTAPYGTLVGCVETMLPPDVYSKAWRNNIRLGFEWMATPHLFGGHDDRVRQAKILEAGACLVDEGRLRVVVDKQFPLNQVAEAHRLQESGMVMGKLSLDIA